MTRRTRIASRAPSLGVPSPGRLAVVHDLPAALPGLAAVGVLVYWSTAQGGYFPRDWYPGALFLLAVLAVTGFAAPNGFRDLPKATRIALAALTTYTAWTYLSITWADAKGVAWDGANRTLLYLVLFALLSRSAVSERGATIVIGAWTAAITVLATVVLLKLPGVIGGGSISAEGLEQPFGYRNANAAIWLMAAWPALLLAACRDMPPWLRGFFTSSVVVLAGTSLLSQSRGTLVATGAALFALFAFVPGRVRALLALLPMALAVAVIAPDVLQHADAVTEDRSAASNLGEVAGPVLLAALMAGAVAAVSGVLEARRPATESTTRLVHRVVAVFGIGIVLAGATAGLVAAGNPVDRVESAWHDFKYTTAPSDSSGHFTSGFGGARYDYYRVALDLFGEHPLTGIGADNFADDYRQRGRAGERPSSPHSLELRTLVQTGVIGTALLLVGLGAAFVAARGAALGVPGLRRAVAAGGALTSLYWVVQGSADWFWEFPALGGAAFAFLGLAGAAPPQLETRSTRLPQRVRVGAFVAGGALVLAAAASLVAPWTADMEIRRAARVWSVSPAAAFRQLDRAADFNPLSERPGMEAGTIALQLGRLPRARRAFEQVLERNPRNVYATVQLGVIASHQGRREDATRFLRRALVLSPGDPVVLDALKQARAGRIDPSAMTRRIFDHARLFAGPQ